MEKVAIVYAKVDKYSTKDELDILDEVALVKKALKELGYHPVELAATLNLENLLKRVKKFKPSFVFNLTESLDGKDSLVALVPALMDSAGVKYTGAPTEAFYLTANKIIAKKFFAGFKINTPAWMTFDDVFAGKFVGELPYIVKSIRDHASIGLDEESVFFDRESLVAEVKNKKENKNNFFVEQFINGREFNISILGGLDKPEVLPPAEIRFVGYPEDKPKIVGYRAKWESSSIEYKSTVRSFDFQEKDKALIIELKSIALKCWELFGLRGYARVDFRVDKKGIPYVLEINTNPCISPDAGFIASAKEAGLDVKDVIKRIIDDSIKQG